MLLKYFFFFDVSGLPLELYSIWIAYPWIFGEPLCIIKVYFSEITTSASVLTITAFTVERYVAICHPLRAQTMSNMSRAIRIILCIWVFAALTSLPFALTTRAFYYLRHPTRDEWLAESHVCNTMPEYKDEMKYVIQLTALILFIVPMAVISILYVLIGLTLRRSGLGHRPVGSSRTSSVSAGGGQSASSASPARKAILKMLVAVVVAFFMCWAPFHAQRLMASFITKAEDWTDTTIELNNILYYISGVTYYVSSTVNPILYNLMSKKYRAAFKQTLCSCCLRPEQRFGRNGRTVAGYSEHSRNAIAAPTPNTRLLAPDRSDGQDRSNFATPDSSSSERRLNTSPTESTWGKRWNMLRNNIFFKKPPDRKNKCAPNNGRETGKNTNGALCAVRTKASCCSDKASPATRRSRGDCDDCDDLEMAQTLLTSSSHEDRDLIKAIGLDTKETATFV